MKKILIFGVTGLVGKALVNEFKSDFDIYGTSRNEITSTNYSNLKFDLEYDPVETLLNTVKPDMIISCIRGDFEKQLLLHEALVAYCKRNSRKLIFFSTANVFDGSVESVKNENDPLCSVSDYGRFKIECENLIRKNLDEKYVIVRLPMVMGAVSPRVNALRNAIKSNEKITTYDNLIMSVITDVEITKQLRWILEKDYTGVFHLSSIDTIKHDTFYRMILGNQDLLDLQTLEEADLYYLALNSKRQELENFKFTIMDTVEMIKIALESERE